MPAIKSTTLSAEERELWYAAQDALREEIDERLDGRMTPAEKVVWDASRRALLAEVHKDLDALDCPQCDDRRKPALRVAAMIEARPNLDQPLAPPHIHPPDTVCRWEQYGEHFPMTEDGAALTVLRMRVPGGWTITNGITLLFIADPKWEWIPVKK